MSKLFNCMEADVVLNQFRDEIVMGLNHSDDSIRLVCLKQVRNYCAVSESITYMYMKCASLLKCNHAQQAGHHGIGT